MTNDFDKFFEKFQVTDRNAKANFMSLTGGRWYVPKEEKSHFFKLYQTYCLKKKYFLVFKSPRTNYQPFRLDVDFKTKSQVPLDINCAFEFAKHVTSECFDKNTQFFICSKDKGYFKNVRDKRVYATGFHVYFPNTKINLDECTQIRECAMNCVLEFFKDEYLESVDEIIDKRISHRMNGLMLIGTFKPNSTEAGRYTLKCGGCAAWDEPRHDFEDAATGMQGVEALYDFVFEDDDPNFKDSNCKLKPTKQKPPKKVRSVPAAVQAKTVEEQVIFDLKLYLQATKNHIPTNSEYKGLLGYLRTINYDPTEAQRLCNKFWNYNSSETSRYLQKISPGYVSIGTAIRYFNEHAENQGLISEIWKLQFENFTKLNHFKFIYGRTIKKENLYKIFRSIFCQIWGRGSPNYIYQEDSWTKNGKFNIKQSNFVVINCNPFEKFDRKVNVVFPATRENALKFMKLCKNKTPQYQKLVSEESGLSTKELVQRLVDQYDFTPTVTKTQPLSKLFKECVLDNTLDVYHSFTSTPCLSEEGRDRLTARNQINIWPINALLSFVPTKQIDITKTLTWFWLKTILCRDDPYKLDWLNCYHQEKILNGHRKIEKIMIFFSAQTGTGKSSHKAFMIQLLGVAHCLKIDSVLDLFKEFNSCLLNKLLVYIDDAERLKADESNKLKSKATETSYNFQKKYADTIPMAAYHDLVVSTNKKSCLYIEPEDRRIEFIHVQEKLSHILPAKEFWTQWYAERDDPNIGKAFLDYFMAYESPNKLDVRRKECRFSNFDLDESILKSTKVSYIFLAGLFEELFFYESLINTYERQRTQGYADRYFEDFTFKKGKFLCKHKFLYKLFKHFIKETGRRSELVSSTFKQQIDELGFKCGSRKFRGKRNHNVWTLDATSLQTAFVEVANIKTITVAARCFIQKRIPNLQNNLVITQKNKIIDSDNKLVLEMQKNCAEGSFRFGMPEAGFIS